MHVSIDFSPEIENTLRRRAAAAGQDLATFVKEAVADRLAQEDGAEPALSESHEQFMDKLRGIIALHPASNWQVDDSRESIYAGRGE